MRWIKQPSNRTVTLTKHDGKLLFLSMATDHFKTFILQGNFKILLSSHPMLLRESTDE